MTTIETPSCDQLVEAHLASRIADIQELTEARHAAQEANDDDAYDEADEALNNFPLDISTQTTMVILLSTGGPADQIEVDIEKVSHAWERSDSHVTYRYMDWFDGAAVRTDDPTILAYVDSLLECYYPEG